MGRKFNTGLSRWMPQFLWLWRQHLKTCYGGQHQQQPNPASPGSVLGWQFFSGCFLGKISWDLLTATLLRAWTVQRLNSRSNPFSTGESSTTKKDTFIVRLGYLWRSHQRQRRCRRVCPWPCRQTGSRSRHPRPVWRCDRRRWFSPPAKKLLHIRILNQGF